MGKWDKKEKLAAYLQALEKRSPAFRLGESATTTTFLLGETIPTFAGDFPGEIGLIELTEVLNHIENVDAVFMNAREYADLRRLCPRNVLKFEEKAEFLRQGLMAELHWVMIITSMKVPVGTIWLKKGIVWYRVHNHRWTSKVGGWDDDPFEMGV